MGNYQPRHLELSILASLTMTRPCATVLLTHVRTMDEKDICHFSAGGKWRHNRREREECYRDASSAPDDVRRPSAWHETGKIFGDRNNKHVSMHVLRLASVEQHSPRFWIV